ncbi:GNAT family N-acetyltransferase [Gottfriedia sp. S16(2024)]|uniref:GNAT family N-acetyltransferase n=1 Tax=Gottfriedia sp. S16(2024) TaxID=3162883 RepID=UPI000A9902F6
MEIAIRQVNKEDVWELRHKVMWPDQPFDYIKLKDDDLGEHYGLFKGFTLISVISIFIINGECQFRKFATLQQEQGKGYGSTLLDYVINEVQNYNVRKIWCNARKNKVNFYKKFGLEETNTSFIKDGKDYVIMENYL